MKSFLLLNKCSFILHRVFGSRNGPLMYSGFFHAAHFQNFHFKDEKWFKNGNYYNGYPNYTVVPLIKPIMLIIKHSLINLGR